jgi:hypothetical protein
MKPTLASGVRLLITMTALSALATAVSSPAQADPPRANCQSEFVATPANHGYYAWCNGGPGEFRIAIQCDPPEFWRSKYWNYGPWRRVASNDSSTAYCDTGFDDLVAHHIDYR